uniref:Methuselah N-terminal domain-containing protein n=1 Tax=Musca domestica TaxID=7370 RepID=A0A1I8NK33_MUSDO
MPYDNGSYSYQNIIIPKANVSIYEYRLEFLDTRRPVPGHPRACVCGPRHHGKYCIKLCCEPGEFYNETSLSCMEIPRYQNVPSEMTIMAEDYEQKLVNVFQKFTYQVGLPCDKPKVLSSDLDTWDILEVSHNVRMEAESQEKKLNGRIKLYVVILVRLFLLMGITWIMDILSFCVRNYPQFDMFFVLTDFCNAIQGVLIFILFVMRRKVTSLLKAKFLGKTVKGNCDDSIQFHSTLSMSTKVT